MVCLVYGTLSVMSAMLISTRDNRIHWVLSLCIVYSDDSERRAFISPQISRVWLAISRKIGTDRFHCQEETNGILGLVNFAAQPVIVSRICHRSTALRDEQTETRSSAVIDRRNGWLAVVTIDWWRYTELRYRTLPFSHDIRRRTYTSWILKCAHVLLNWSAIGLWLRQRGIVHQRDVIDQLRKSLDSTTQKHANYCWYADIQCASRHVWTDSLSVCDFPWSWLVDEWRHL